MGNALHKKIQIVCMADARCGCVTLRFRMSRLKSGSSDEEKSEQTLKISVEVNKFC